MSNPVKVRKFLSSIPSILVACSLSWGVNIPLKCFITFYTITYDVFHPFKNHLLSTFCETGSVLSVRGLGVRPGFSPAESIRKKRTVSNNHHTTQQGVQNGVPARAGGSPSCERWGRLLRSALCLALLEKRLKSSQHLRKGYQHEQCEPSP